MMTASPDCSGRNLPAEWKRCCRDARTTVATASLERGNRGGSRSMDGESHRSYSGPWQVKWYAARWRTSVSRARENRPRTASRDGAAVACSVRSNGSGAPSCSRAPLYHKRRRYHAKLAHALTDPGVPREAERSQREGKINAYPGGSPHSEPWKGAWNDVAGECRSRGG